MDYKDIYEELNRALWGGCGLLYDLRDPFHNSLGNLETQKTLDTIKIAQKFAHKLYLDTHDEYALKTLELICGFVGESYINADTAAVTGTEYDPEFMFDGIEPKDCVEPKPNKTYVVNTVTINGEENIKEEKNEEFLFFEDAKAYMENAVKDVRETYKQIYEESKDDRFLLTDEEREFAANGNRFVVRIIEKES